MLEIICARTPADLDEVRTLLSGLAAYFSSLGHGDIAPDAFFGEIEGPDAQYVEPDGRIMLARTQGAPVGCAMLRPLEDGVCEVRRVFVVPEARRQGVARELMVRLMAEARESGYSRMRLMTGAGFVSAITLYEGLGFSHIPRYRPVTWEDIACMEVEL